MAKPVPPLLLACDPGARGCGVALFHHGSLVRAEYVAYKHTKEPMPSGAGAWWGMAHMVVEWGSYWTIMVCGTGIKQYAPADMVVLVEDMKVYAGSRSKGDPADLLHLAAVGGGVACLFASMGWTPESVKASVWNGQLPREIRQERTAAWLEARDEIDRVIRPAVEPRLVHNAFSAVGQARWRLDPTAK